jgi:hypothetical protein
MFPKRGQAKLFFGIHKFNINRRNAKTNADFKTVQKMQKVPLKTKLRKIEGNTDVSHF